MGTMKEIREINRAATKVLLEELGYDPNDVLDRRGDAVLDWDEFENKFALEVVERDEDGIVVVIDHEAKTHTDYVEVTDARLNQYRRALWRGTQG